MNIKLNEFIRDNLIAGYHNGSFTEQQVNIFALNYFNRGQITQEDFQQIQDALYPPEVEEIEE